MNEPVVVTLERIILFKSVVSELSLNVYHWLLYPFLSTGAGQGVRFSLRGKTYQNNSIVSLEDIGEGRDALLCLTDQPACCRHPYTKPMGQNTIGNWFFPNGTRVPSSGNNWGFHRTRGPSVVLMAREKGGVDGIYYCDIPDTAGVIQTVYIGVYNTSTGECYNTCTLLFLIISAAKRKHQCGKVPLKKVKDLVM